MSSSPNNTVSKFSAKGIPWNEGDENDFSDLHQAIQDGKTKQNTYNAEIDTSSDNSSSSEDDVEPPESQPGLRLLWACQHNSLESVESLLKTDPNLLKFRDEDGYTALHRASYSNHPQIALLLLKSGADISARTDEEQWQPIHSACRWNAAETVEVLLNWGSDVNATTSGGQTPLHLAAFCGKSQNTLQILLMHPKLKTMTKNAQGDTPKDIAIRNGNCVKLFDLVQPAYRDIK
jgi:ankyrin repeat protein